MVAVKFCQLRPFLWAWLVMVWAWLPCVAAESKGAGGWPQWRGPAFNGTCEAKGLPDQWGPGTNMPWVVELPGIGAGTPIIQDGRVYVGAFEKEPAVVWAICFSAADGKELWRQKVASGVTAKKPESIAGPSAVVEAGRVVFTFSSGDMAAFDCEGKSLWSCNLLKRYGQLGNKFGYSSTPALHDGRLFVQLLRDIEKPSLLICLDIVTGKELWKVERPTAAKEENKDSYASPCIFVSGGRTLVVVAGGDIVTANDVADGHEVWRSDCYAFLGQPNTNRLIPSPVVAGDRIVVPVNRGKLLVAAKVGLAGWSWAVTNASSDVCSPLFYQGKIYVIESATRKMFCVDPETGALLNTVKLPGKNGCFSSPTEGDGKIYALTLGGSVAVIKAGREMEVLRLIEMGDNSTGSSIAIAEGRLFIRTNTKLFCIGQ